MDYSDWLDYVYVCVCFCSFSFCLVTRGSCVCVFTCLHFPLSVCTFALILMLFFFSIVGETGCGKTTVCQLFSLVLNRRLNVINCHQHTETSDFLGGLRPVRNKERTLQELRTNCAKLFAECTQFATKVQTTQVQQPTTTSASLSSSSSSSSSLSLSSSSSSSSSSISTPTWSSVLAALPPSD